MPRLFISHSSRDQEMAGLLVDLLRSALNLPAEDIRCTSVAGHRLAGGQETDRALRTEIRDCKAFIGLISEASIESAYVLFELGARWGIERHLLPLLAPNADSSLLRGPLSGINALSCSNATDLHQMILELGEILGLKPEGPPTYQRRIDEILGLVARSIVPPAIDEADPIEQPDQRVSSNLSDDEFAGADNIIKRHCESQWSDDFSMRNYCINQQEQALAELRRGRPADVPEDVFQCIRTKCGREWSNDFSMRQYCEEEQFKAYRNLRNRGAR
jgi:hypothetical protein